MGVYTWIHLAMKSLLARRASALLTLLAVALSSGLFLGVEKTRTSVRSGFENTLAGTDLIVGARTSPVNLLLASVFRIGDVSANIPWSVAENLNTRSDVAWIIPLSLGDNHRGYRVLGTTSAYYEHYRYGRDTKLSLTQGNMGADLFDAVIGIEIAKALNYTLGDEIELTHGLGTAGISDHEHRPFKIAGILAPTGTPVDRTVHVSLEAITAIHVGWETGARHPLADAITTDQLRSFNLTPRDVSAILIGLKDKTSLLRTKRDIDTLEEAALVAVIPGLALNDLWQVTALAERALSAISLFVVILGLVSILAATLAGLNARRREMSILRAIGARPKDIAALLIIEAALLAALGTLLGVVLINGGFYLFATTVTARLGVSLAGIGPGLLDLATLLIVTLAASIIALAPALVALRRALVDGLSVKV